MIPIEALRQVTRIIVHADCPDGIASAMILHDALPEASIHAVDYGPERDVLEPLPGLLFCDMTPPPAHAQAFVSAGAIVLDHHDGVSELVALFGERGVFADKDEEPGVSGALLAYRHVWRLGKGPVVGSAAQVKLLEIDRFAELAGIRDTWQTKDPRWRDACAQAEVLMFYSLDTWLSERRSFLNSMDQQLGTVLLNKKLRRAREIAEHSCLRLSPSVAIFNDCPKPDSRISDVAEAMREVDPAVTLVCGFFYAVKVGVMQLEFHLRSSPGCELTALQIALANGGGGHDHDHAAGFTLRVGTTGEPDGVNDRYPIEIFKSALAGAVL